MLEWFWKDVKDNADMLFVLISISCWTGFGKGFGRKLDAAGGDLETNWKQPGEDLEANWKQLGGIWKQIESNRERIWKQIGSSWGGFGSKLEATGGGRIWKQNGSNWGGFGSD